MVESVASFLRKTNSSAPESCLHFLEALVEQNHEWVKEKGLFEFSAADTELVTMRFSKDDRGRLTDTGFQSPSTRSGRTDLR